MKFQLLIAPTLFAFVLPVQAETAAQELDYQSAFEGYKAYSDSEIQNWPKAIQLVDEIGGWRAYAREPARDPARQPARKNEGAVASPTLPAPQPPKPAQPHQHGGAQ